VSYPAPGTPARAGTYLTGYVTSYKPSLEVCSLSSSKHQRHDESCQWLVLNGHVQNPSAKLSLISQSSARSNLRGNRMFCGVRCCASRLDLRLRAISRLLDYNHKLLRGSGSEGRRIEHRRRFLTTGVTQVCLQTSQSPTPL